MDLKGPAAIRNLCRILSTTCLVSLTWAAPQEAFAKSGLPELTRTLLTSTRWGREDQSLGLYLTFDGDGAYTRSLQEPGGRECNGRYTLKENILTLLPGTEQGGPRCPSMQCRLRPARYSLYRKFKLWCKGHRAYWPLKHVMPSGVKRRIRKVAAVTTGPRRALLREKTSVRYSPRPKSSTYKCRRSNGRRFSVFPRGYDFIVVARTEEKIISGFVWKKARKRRGRKRRRVRLPVKHYWYYVNLNPDLRESCPRREGWVSGRYLIFK